MSIDTNVQKIEELLTRGVAEVIDVDHLRERLMSGEQLRIKLGIDPTSPHLHLGRGIPLMKLRDFQDLGHQIIFLVGNATGVIGDTSDKESERPMLSEAEVEENMRQYKEQAAKILDIDKVEVVYNADWLNKLGYAEIGRHAGAFSLHEFIQRDNIKKRLDAGTRISLREVLYPLMQGYDSVHLQSDVELGGTDQKFNLLAGRVLQKDFDQEPQDLLMTNLILGTDGRKMSSSWGNTITLTDTPEDMMEKLMNLPDDLIDVYFEHCTRIELDTVAEIMAQEDKRYPKADLVAAVIEIYHGSEIAAKQKENAIKKFITKEGVEDLVEIKEVSAESNILDMLVVIGAAQSKSDARRKVEQNALSINDQKLTDLTYTLTREHNDAMVKVGKKFMCKIAVS